MNKNKTIDWKAIIDKVSAYSGTIKDFCKENNIPEKQFYYHRRKLTDKNKLVFHEIPLKSGDNSIIKDNSKTDIKIEVGKATIYIPANEIAVLTSIIKELTSNV